MVTPGATPQDNAALRETGKSAVRLLKEMAAMLPLRSDTAQIKKEIARIEKVFGGGEASSKPGQVARRSANRNPPGRA